MKSMGAWSSNELQRLEYMTGCQHSSPSNVCWVTAASMSSLHEAFVPWEYVPYVYFQEYVDDLINQGFRDEAILMA